MSRIDAGDRSRENHFFTPADQPRHEHSNIAPVIFRAEVPTDSVGWSQRDFFANLGNEVNAPGSPLRNAEQEYLLENITKGALYDAARIADDSGYGIAVRPTSLLAHMGIESGDPTKAQEFKNKTSKEVDLFLCDELEWKELGAVVHYHPSVGWTSALGRTRLTPWPAASEHEWRMKRVYISRFRMQELDRNRVRFWPTTEEDWAKVKIAFTDRAREYTEEDHEYRVGRYAPYTRLVGPYVRLERRPDTNMVGDFDLFGFTASPSGEYGRLLPDDTLCAVQQKALQGSHAFQAQHGGIFHWRPTGDFNEGIKNRIMAAHSQPAGDPLIYILPRGFVHAVFFNARTNTLEPVWEYPAATGWRTRQTETREAILRPRPPLRQFTDRRAIPPGRAAA